MAWVKLDDGVPQHRKHLEAGPAASWFWVCAIAYCQRQLTDGFVPTCALDQLGIRKGSRRLVAQLVAVGLFDVVENGYRVHDYLAHNSTRETVQKARNDKHLDKVKAGQAGAKARWQSDSRTIADGNSNAIAPSHPIPSHPIPAPTEPSAARRSAGQPPLNLGLRRIKVWRWMLDDLIDTLGEHAGNFDLEGWLQALDARETRVIGDSWPWLKNEMLTEARRRGLPIVTASDRKPLFTESAETEAKAVLAIVQQRGGVPR